MSLTLEQQTIIKSTVPVLAEHGQAITALFYKTLLADLPSLNAVFNTANQSTGAQPRALAYALHAYASNIDNLAALGPFVERVCQKHASLFVQPGQYDVVATYLLAAMASVLGDALTADVHAAWAAAYWQLANLMIAREASLYSATATATSDSGAWTDWRAFRIVAKIPETPDITSFHLSPVDGKRLPTYLPGQYVSVQVEVASLKFAQARQYSLSDAPREAGDSYRITVRRESGLTKPVAAAVAQGNEAAQTHPGYVSNVLHDLKQVGDEVKLSHPAGDFCLDHTLLLSSASKEPIVLISAGVGITPMMSIVSALLPSSSSSSSSSSPSPPTPRKLIFIHATRSSTHTPFHADLLRLAETHPPSTFRLVIFNPLPSPSAVQGVDYQFKGRLSMDVLEGEGLLSLGEQGATYFVCGPEGFTGDVVAGLKGRGVEEGRMRVERFGLGVVS